MKLIFKIMALMALAVFFLGNDAQAQLRKVEIRSTAVSDTTAVADTTIFEYHKLIDRPAEYFIVVEATHIADSLDATIYLEESPLTTGDDIWIVQDSTVVNNLLDDEIYTFQGTSVYGIRQRLRIINTDGEFTFRVHYVYKSKD